MASNKTMKDSMKAESKIGQSLETSNVAGTLQGLNSTLQQRFKNTHSTLDNK